MTMPPEDIAILRFSTDAFPERDRAAMVREVHGRMIMRFEFEAAPDVPLDPRTVARVLPGLVVSTCSSSPFTARRTRELLADGQDDVILVVPMADGNTLSHLGRELSPRAETPSCSRWRTRS